MGRFPAGGRLHCDVEIPPVAVAGGVAHAVGHQPGALLRGRAGEFARGRIEAQARHLGREAVREPAVTAARRGKRQRINGRSHCEVEIVRTGIQVHRQGPGIQHPPVAAAPVLDPFGGVNAPGGEPAGGGRIEVINARARLSAVVPHRQMPGVAADPLEPVPAFHADLHSVMEGRDTQPVVGQKTKLHAIQPIPAHDHALEETRLERRLVLRRPTSCGRRGQVVPLAVGAYRHVDCLYRPIGGHRKPPVAGPGPQSASEQPAVAGFQLRRRKRSCGAARQCQFHRAPGGGHPGVVPCRNCHPRRRLAWIDQAQTALLRGVGGWTENCHTVTVRARAGVPRLQHRVVDRRERATARTHKGRRHDGDVRIDQQANVPGEAAESARQTLGRVPGLKLRGGDLHCRPGVQFEGNRPGSGPRVVDGDNLRGPGLDRGVDDPQHALCSAAGLRGNEPRDRVPLRLRSRRKPQQGREKHLAYGHGETILRIRDSTFGIASSMSSPRSNSSPMRSAAVP